MRSMTGFGSGRARVGGPSGGEITVEVRSVNQRFLDVKLSLPREYAFFEEEIRRRLQDRVARGRVEVSVSRSRRKAGPLEVEVNEPLARAYVKAFERLRKRLRLSGDVDLSFLQGRSDVVRVREPENRPEQERPALRRALGAALRQHDEARRREGRALGREVNRRVRRLRQLTGSMTSRARAVVPQARRELRQKMKDLLQDRLDETRLAQEAAFLAERSDVTEELVRLASHLEGLEALLRGGGVLGRRFEFLLQEVQREVNTTAAKATDLRLTRLAVDAKGEVEKLREQIQNVE